MKRMVVIVTLALASACAKHETSVAMNHAPAALQPLGSHITPNPPGPGKEVADAACLICHSSDMLRQQHLTEKQWTGTVDKMIRWGAPVKEEQKALLIAYLTKNFGPENRFRPVEVLPAR
jgi:cytochrome c5